MAVTLDARLVAQRLPQGRAQADAHVLDGMVLIDAQVALGLDRKIDRGVLGQQREHVVQEAHARADLGAACAVDLQRQLDLGLGRFALNASGS